MWGHRRRPYRERQEGVSVIRLPLWVGRASATERYRQELTFALAQTAAIPLLPAADVVVSASPSFPALLPGILNSRLRRLPWVVWLHDILPDGAVSTGLVEDGLVLSAARRLERAAYANASRIIILSRSFAVNLTSKGVPQEKIRLIYDPATRVPAREPAFDGKQALRVLCMGNIGHSQGLAPLVEAFDRDPRMAEIGAQLIITGEGVAADAVREVIRSDRVQMRGVISDAELEEELQSARIGLVTQHYAGSEFNIPSKLMNFMAYGLPVLAAVNPEGEVARIVREASAGWTVNSAEPSALPQKLYELSQSPAEIAERAGAAYAYANRNFTADAFAAEFESELLELTG